MEYLLISLFTGIWIQGSRLILPLDLEGDQVVPVWALVLELLAVLPGDLPIHADTHQGRKEVVVAVATEATRLMGVDLEDVRHLMAGAATLSIETTLAS